VHVLSPLLYNEPHRPSLCLAPRSTSPCALGSTSVLLPRPRLRPPLLPAPLCSLPPLRSRSTPPLPCSATAPFPRHLDRLSSRPPNDHLRRGCCLSTLLLAACSATAPSPVPSPAYPPNRAECLPTFPSSRSGPRSSSGTSLTGTMVSRRLGASPRVRQHIPHSSYHLHMEAACSLGGWVWAQEPRWGWRRIEGSWPALDEMGWEGCARGLLAFWEAGERPWLGLSAGLLAQL